MEKAGSKSRAVRALKMPKKSYALDEAGCGSADFASSSRKLKRPVDDEDEGDSYISGNEARVCDWGGVRSDWKGDCGDDARDDGDDGPLRKRSVLRYSERSVSGWSSCMSTSALLSTNMMVMFKEMFCATPCHQKSQIWSTRVRHVSGSSSSFHNLHLSIHRPSPCILFLLSMKLLSV